MSCTERRTSRCCAGAIAALAAAPVRAAPETAPPAHPGGFDTGTLASIGFGLVAVVAAILILAWLARQVPMLRRSSGPIAILGGLNVGNRERIVLVEVQGERILLGVTPGSVTALHVLEHAGRRAAADMAGLEPMPVPARHGSDFRTVLADFHRAREDGGGPPHP